MHLGLLATRAADPNEAGAFLVQGQVRWVDPAWEGAGRALKPGGTLVVSELPYPNSPGAYRAEPVYKMLVEAQLHAAVVGCGAITQRELRELLKEADFADVQVAGQPLPTRFVMLGEKLQLGRPHRHGHRAVLSMNQCSLCRG